MKINGENITLGRWLGRLESKLEASHGLHKSMQADIQRIEEKLDRLEAEVQGMVVANKVRDDIARKEELKRYHIFSRKSDFIIMGTALLALILSVLHIGVHGL